MNSRFNKYWLNFNLLLFLVMFLVLPFIPYASFQSSPQSSESNVLAEETQRIERILLTDVIEATFSAGEAEKTIEKALKFTNTLNEPSEVRVEVREDGVLDSFEEKATFFESSQEVMYLYPSQEASIDLKIINKNSSAKTSGRFVISILTTL